MDNYTEYRIAMAAYPDKVYPFEYKGLELFAHRSYTVVCNRFREADEGWTVTERTTGLAVGYGRTKAEAVESTMENIDHNQHLEDAIRYVEFWKEANKCGQ
jgi:hypothetical protein